MGDRPLAGLAVIGRLLARLFPIRCIGCGSPNAARLCGACQAAWPELEGAPCPGCGLPRKHACPASAAGFEATWSAAVYAGVARQAVHALKYRGVRAAARPLAQRMGAGLPDEGWLVVPVPLHAARRRQRGYNQAELLARELARQRGWRWSPALVRRRATRPSPGLDRAARAANLLDAFCCVRPVAGRAVLLVDDVLTTGATATEAARVLRAAGATRVALAVVARTP